MVDSIVPESDEEENYENDDFAGLNDEDTMKILVTSDINLGYEETLQRSMFYQFNLKLYIVIYYKVVFSTFF